MNPPPTANAAGSVAAVCTTVALAILGLKLRYDHLSATKNPNRVPPARQ